MRLANGDRLVGQQGEQAVAFARDAPQNRIHVRDAAAVARGAAQGVDGVIDRRVVGYAVHVEKLLNAQHECGNGTGRRVAIRALLRQPFKRAAMAHCPIDHFCEKGALRSRAGDHSVGERGGFGPARENAQGFSTAVGH